MMKAAFEVLPMTKQDAVKITTEYLRPVYGFALKRCRNLHDAEDLTQDIVWKVFRALLNRDDIADVPRFVWTVAHNCLVNYYRDKRYETAGLSPEEVAAQLPDGTDMETELIRQSEILRLRREIAYLSKLQREIVIAFF